MSELGVAGDAELVHTFTWHKGGRHAQAKTSFVQRRCSWEWSD